MCLLVGGGDRHGAEGLSVQVVLAGVGCFRGPVASL